MDIQTKIKFESPLPIAKLFEAMTLETDVRQRVLSLLNLFEHTAQYLALVGLARYRQLNLHDARVEKLRPRLVQTSIGTWVDLALALNVCLADDNPQFLTATPTRRYRDTPIGEATNLIKQMLGLHPIKKPSLINFMEAMVELRNKKRGHGLLTALEAAQIAKPLEVAVTQFLGELPTLYTPRLLYVDEIKVQNRQPIGFGTGLNSGLSLNPAQVTATADTVDRQVYLHLPEDDQLVPLYPYFSYSPHQQALYIYTELNNAGQLVLRCPYVPPGVDPAITITADKTTVIGTPEQPQPSPKSKTRPTKEAYSMQTWSDLITPHEDIRHGNFDEAVFAADLGDVASGKAPADYSDAFLFFKKTYLTAGLTGLLKNVHAKLSAGTGSAVVQVQTPFGGGKTHALVTIFHYLQHGADVKELLPSGVPVIEHPHIAAIAGNHADPVAGNTSEGVTRRTFWGEIAWQLGGRAAYEQLREHDEKQISPGKEKLRALLEPYQPFVLLFDEILEYINRAMDRRTELDVSLGTQTFSFFQELTEAVSTLPNGMLIVTLPSSKLEDFGEKQEEALARLGKIFGRLESIATPVQGEEIYAVIRRRLFEVETLKTTQMREVVTQYFSLYQQNKQDLPPKVRDANYRHKMELAYPFHPDLIDTLIEKWSTYPTFQRTRGVLRLLANIIEDLYRREAHLDMILPGDINLGKSEIRREFLKHIGGEYEGVITSDISGVDAKSQLMDKENRSWKHLAERVSNSIFFNSFSADNSEKGTTLPYIKLAVLRSDTIPSLVTDILQRLSNELWYLNSRGDAYYFSHIPNLNRMILDKKEMYNQSYEEELRHIIDKEVGRKFNAYLWPETGDAIPDNRALKLVILRPEDNGADIPAWVERKGNTFRVYKNTLFFATADTAAFARLREDVKTYLALKEIESSIQSDKASQLAPKRDEIQRRIRAIKRDFSYNVRRMYRTIHFGNRRQDLGEPVTGQEDLSTWYWRELTDGNVGAIVERLGYRIIVNKLLAGNDHVSTAIILDQFYKEPGLPVPSQPEVVARAIQLGIQEKALGLVEMRNDELQPTTLKFGDSVSLDEILFEQDIYLVSREKAEALKAEIPAPSPLPGFEATAPTPSTVEAQPTGTATTPPPAAATPDTPAVYHRVRLVIRDIPAGKVADVNRGVLLPLAGTVQNLQFSIELDVTSADGISHATLENKIKETIRQIGANIAEEQLE